MSNNMQTTTALPLMENEHVKDLLDVLKRCGKDTSGLTSLINYVGEMEGFVKRMEDTISSMKTQLDSIQDKQNHPLKNYLTNTIARLEKKVASLKEQISKIKSQIVEGCKKALSAFKETGVSALTNLASFFRVKRDMIQYVNNLDYMINANKKTVSKIEAFTNQYHAAGAHIKNMARVAVGKEPLLSKKEAGKLSKAVSTPYLMHNKLLVKLKESTEKGIAGLEKMESKQAEKKAERELNKKPSMLEKLAENKARVEQIKRSVPAVDRMKTQGLEV
jgi:cob(I)alamin adenosyltransferase